MTPGPSTSPPAAAGLAVAGARATAAASEAASPTSSSASASGARAAAVPSDSSPAGADTATLLFDPASLRSGTAAAAGAAPALAVHTEVGASGWTEEIGTQVVWMAHQGVTEASLRLQPEHLGPLEVRISLHAGDASVWFGSSAPATRAALEQALPQLKEMFAAQGMTLTDAGVSRESAREAQYPQRPGSSTAAEAETATEVSAAAPRRGLIDTYV
jgi:flagellar hook-length control protein FliK